MVVVGFDDRVEFRIREEEKLKALSLIRENPDLYDDISHFARSWFIRGLREYKEPERENEVFER